MDTGRWHCPRSSLVRQSCLFFGFALCLLLEFACGRDGWVCGLGGDSWVTAGSESKQMLEEGGTACDCDGVVEYDACPGTEKGASGLVSIWGFSSCFCILQEIATCSY